MSQRTSIASVAALRAVVVARVIRVRDSLATLFPGSPFAAWKRAASRPPKRPTRADSYYVHLPATVRARLAGVANRILLERRLRGLCWLVGTCAVLLPFQALWDWLVDLPVAARSVLLGVDLVIAGGIVRHFWIVPRRPDLEECALLVERRFPELRSALISAVQFSSGTPGPIAVTLLDQIEARTATLSFRDVSPLTGLRRYAWVAGALLAIPLAIVPLAQPTSGILLRRLLLGNEPLPAATTLVFVTGDAEIIAGEDVRIEARATGRLPLAGRLDVLRPGASTLVLTLVRSATAPDTYAASIQNPQESFTYRVQVKDAVSEEFSIKVVRPPALASIRLTQHFPAYTGKEPVAMEPGDLSLFAGGRLRIEATATKPLRSARIVVADREPIPLTIAGESMEGDLPIPALGLDGFSIALQDTDGVNSRDDMRYRARIVPDDPPRIEWASGGLERRTLLVETKPSLAFSVSDDFQVTRVELVAVVSPGEHRIRIPIQIPRPGPAYAFDETIEQPGALLPWEGGAIIAYWIEARDNNDVTGPGVGRSAIREWTVVTREQKRREMQERLREGARRIRELADQQKVLRDEVGRMVEP